MRARMVVPTTTPDSVAQIEKQVSLPPVIVNLPKRRDPFSGANTSVGEAHKLGGGECLILRK
jgi:hypothetical protein